MVWQQWLYLGLSFAGLLGTVWLIGKPRQPITPGYVIGAALTQALYVWLVLSI
jgi:hypothetical protein